MLSDPAPVLGSLGIASGAAKIKPECRWYVQVDPMTLLFLPAAPLSLCPNQPPCSDSMAKPGVWRSE